MSERKAVHIVDDEDSVRRSVAFLLRTAGFDVHAYASGVAFLKEVRTVRPGCILLDVRMPEMDGMEVQRELAARGVTMPIVVLTGHGDVPIAVEAMKAGAVDFLEKPFEKSVLLAALDVAFKRVERCRRAAVSAREAATRIARLTPREREVLLKLADGLPNKTIAYDFGISARTVEAHRANIMAKLEVHSFSAALRLVYAANAGAEMHDVTEGGGA